MRFANLLATRLEVARHVAWIKFQDHAPVSDPIREAEILNTVTNAGVALGIPAEEARRLFAAQLRASRLAQEQLIRGWSRGATLPAYAPADLGRDIRPRIDAINRDILDAWKNVPHRAAGFRRCVEQQIRDRGFSWRVARTAAAPL